MSISSCFIVLLGSCKEKDTKTTLIVVIVVFSFAALITISLILFFKGGLRCLQKENTDALTPARRPMRGPSTPDVVVEIPAALQPLAESFTPTINNANGAEVRESSTRRRNKNSANKENIMNADSVNNSKNKNDTNAKAKRGLFKLSEDHI